MFTKKDLVLLVRKLPLFVKHSIHFIFEKKFRRYNNLFKIPDFYVKWVAPNLAFYIYWMAWPFFYFCKKRQILFLVNNITNSPGHVIVELDYFFKTTCQKGEMQAPKYIAVWPRSEVSHGAQLAYRNFFYKFFVSDFLYAFFLPFIIRYENITSDFGLSLVDKSLKRCKNYGYPFLPLFKEGSREFGEVWDRFSMYYRLRQNTWGLTFTRPGVPMDDRLLQFIGIENNEYAVLQIKDIAGNGTAKATDSDSYIDSINYLQNKGYKIVFAGREKMPPIFQRFGVVNYSEWIDSSFYYDLQLAANAAIVISSASGFANLPDTMEVPLVYTNQWSFICPPPGRFTITVPALFRNPDNIAWKFASQIEYFYNQSDSNTAIPENLNPRNAEKLEILEAIKEAFNLKNKFQEMSPLQTRFHLLFPGTPLEFAESRISQNFIEKFESSF